MANIPSAAQMASNPSAYALRDYSGGVQQALGLGGGKRMSIRIGGRRASLTPEQVRRATAERERRGRREE